MWWFVFLWLVSLNMMSSSSIHIAEDDRTYFCGWIIFHCEYILFFILPSAYGHLGRFHISAVVNSATINMEVHAFFWCTDFISYMYEYIYIYTLKIVGSYRINSFLYPHSIKQDQKHFPFTCGREEAYPQFWLRSVFSLSLILSLSSLGLRTFHCAILFHKPPGEEEFASIMKVV
jgi:hypothetical protein